MKTILDLIFLAIIICFIIDCSGIMNDIRKLIAKIIFKYTKIKVEYQEINIKPFMCSLCSVWWGGLIYLLVFGKFTLEYIAFVSLLSLLSSNISGFLLTIKDYLATFENWLQKIIQN